MTTDDAPGEYELVAGTLDMGPRHIDNTAFPDYVAEVRKRFLRDTVPTFEEYHRPVVHLELDFHAELYEGDRVYGDVEVLDIGTTSFTTEVTLSTETEVVATAKSIQVTLDTETKEPTPVPDGWREALEAELEAGTA